MKFDWAIERLQDMLDEADQSFDIEALELAIKSIEAWEKVEKEIDDSILICQESAQNNTWCDGELVGFLQSKDIIDRNLLEVEE